ncbi:hypothetical protein BaRGS_00005500 [Batillaria attramentaria]|uniref:Uncharacterized protein n=1 Tax=Batillaria attramentaria TaxID=370345 RepID=A0ABD0LVQ8_9CAEN
MYCSLVGLISVWKLIIMASQQGAKHYEAVARRAVRRVESIRFQSRMASSHRMVALRRAVRVAVSDRGKKAISLGCRRLGECHPVGRH